MKIAWGLFFILLFTATVFPQWVRTNGPYGGSVTCFSAVNDSTGSTYIFAGDGYGIYRSPANKINWIPANSGLKENKYGNLNINAFAVIGNNIFAGGVLNDIYLSTNCGSIWTKVSVGLDNDRYNGIFTFAVNGSTIFAGTESGIYRSTNQGKNWTAADSGLPKNTAFTGLTVCGTNIFAGGWQGVYISTNNGASWTSADSGLPVSIFFSNSGMALASIGMDIFAGTDYGVFHSTDNGTFWEKASSGLPEDAFGRSFINKLTAYEGYLYAAIYNPYKGVSSEIFISTDNGSSWKDISSGLPEILYIDVLAAAGKNLLISSAQGIYHSTDNGVNWTSANSGIVNTGITALAADGTNIIAGAALQGIYLSGDNGENWSDISSGLPGNSVVEAFAASGTNIFAGGRIGNGYNDFSTLLFLYDGTKWTDISHGLPQKDVTVQDFALCGSNIFAATGHGVFRSTDNGTKWISADSGFPKNYGASVLAVKDTILFGGSIYGVWITSDNGKHWNYTGPGLPVNPTVSALAVSGNNIFAGVSHSEESTTNTGVFVSTDNGNSWTKTSDGLPQYYSISDIAMKGDNIFVSSHGEGIYVSTNNGKTWTNFSRGLMPETGINCLAISSKYIFAGTPWRGVWRRPLSDITDVQASTERQSPAGFLLEQNYPNPFNPSTTIKYSIPDEGKVTLSIYNVLGEEVSVIVDEMLKAGIHEVTFNSGGLPSGVYFYTLIARSASGDRNFRSTKKFILLK